MKNKRKQGMLKKLLAMILGFTIMISIVNGIQMSANEGDTGGRDLTADLVYNIETLQTKKYGTNQFVDVIKDGIPVEPAPEIYRNDSARIAFKFSINKQVAVKDYFKITVPEGILKLNRSIIKPLMNGEEEIGAIELNPSDKEAKNRSTLKVTFSKEGASILDGFLAAVGTFSELKSNVTFSLNQDGSLQHTINVVDRPKEDNDKFSPGKSPKQPIQPTMNKHGYYNYDENWFVYSLVINGDERSKLYKQNITGTDRIRTRKNIYVFDELPEGMTFHTTKRSGVETFRFNINFDVPAYENDVIMKDTMSNTLGASVTLSFPIPAEGGISEIKIPRTKEVLFTFDKSNQDKTWEEFQKYVRDKNDRRIGIWKNKKMIINVGTLPMSGVKYEDFYVNGEEGFKAALQNSLNKNVISKEQKELMEKAYIGQEIVSFLFDYRTFVDGLMEDSYNNRAYFNYDDVKVYPRNVAVKFDWIKGRGRMIPFSEKVVVKKIWHGKEGTSANISLTASNDPRINISAEIKSGGDGSGAWTHTFSGLKEFKEGTTERLRYKVTEKPHKGYRAVVKPTNIGYEITNIEQMNFTVRKEWKDHNNLSITPNLPIKISLYREGSLIPLSTGEIKSGADSYTFENLDKYELDGTPIKYYAKENEIPKGYRVSYSEATNEDDSFKITNTKLNPADAKRSIQVLKIWKDNEGRIVNGKKDSEIAPIKIYLVKNNTRQADFVTLTKENKWTDKFTNLPVFDDLGKEIQYTVEEDSLPNYAPRIRTGTMEDGFEITNQLLSKKIEVTKVWKKADGVTKFNHPQLPEIEVEVLDDTDTSVAKKILSFFTDGWKAIFEGLPANKTYKVKENPVSGYIPENMGSESSFILTNTMEKREDITVTKKWVKPNGITELSDKEKNELPETIEVTLHEDETSPVIETLVLRKEDNFVGKFTNLPKYEVDGKTEINYVVKEIVPTGFLLESMESDDKNNFIITNKQEGISIQVTKEWKKSGGVEELDASEQLEELTVHIRKKGESDVIKTDKLTKTDGWTKTFTDLPKYEGDGSTEIEYEVKEEPVSGFKEGVVLGNQRDGFVITNEKLPEEKKPSVISLQVRKEWKKSGGVEELDASEQPDSITISLYKKGTDNIIKMDILTKDGGWTKTFTDLPKYEDDGSTEIEYVIKELQLNGFKEAVISGNQETGFVITNEKLTPINNIYVPEMNNTWEIPKEDEKTEEEPKREPEKEEETIPTTPPSLVPLILIPNIPFHPNFDEPTPTVVSTEIPAMEVPKVPKIPSIIPILKENIPELELNGDEVPLGDAEVRDDKNGDSRSNVDPARYKRELARTGGMENILVPMMGIFLFLLGFLGVIQYVKKKN